MMMERIACLTMVYCCFLALFLAGNASCNHPAKEKQSVSQDELKEPLIKANQEAVRTESIQIDDFISRHGWHMIETPTGLRYNVYVQGSGPQCKKGSIVTLLYSITLLTGDTVYSSRSDGPLIFEAGKGQVISGLEEAILFMRVGDRAKIIIPSHLAYGLIGDQNKINHKASLVYDLEFVGMK